LKLSIERMLSNYVFVTFPLLNLSKSKKNSSILTLFITTHALSLSSTSVGLFDVSTLFSKNLLLITSRFCVVFVK
jgi:hypothetical protein